MKEITFTKILRRHTFTKVLEITVLIFLTLVSLSGAAPFAYITNSGDNTVSVIDTVTNNATATVNVGKLPFGVAPSPDGKKVYVVNYLSNNVSVIDTATNKVTTTVNVGNLPFGTAFSPDGKKLYVANFASENISVIDTATNIVIASINTGNYPWGIAISPDGTKVYAASLNSNYTSVINTTTNTVVATVKVGNAPWGVAVSPVEKKVFVTNANSNTISIIDTTTNNVTATVNVGKSPWGVAVSPNGKRVYVANSDGNDVSVIDTPTNTVISTVKVGNLPCGVTINIDGTKVYVVNSDSNNISVINTTTNTVTAKVNVGSLPVAMGKSIASPSFSVAPSSFSAFPTSGKMPLNVSFTDWSTGSPTSWKWTFGDGNTSTQQNPVYRYNKTGVYTVTLTASNTGSSNTVTKSSYIAVSNSIAAPVAAFSAFPTSGKVPLNVSFTDKSAGSPTSWKWNFGDGNTSTEKNPLHAYNKTGLFTVTLTASNAGGSNTVIKSSYIAVSSSLNTPVTNFSASPTSGKVPLNVSFTDRSTGSSTSWKWTFGDGNTSTKQNPVYKYNKTGKYNVALTASNAAGSDTVTKYGCINVTSGSGSVVPNPSYIIPVTAFSASLTSGKVPLNVSFTDRSIGSPTSWKWIFGDGNISTEKNPVHTYNKTGTYTVTLTASNAGGSDTVAKTSYIVVSSSLNNPVTNFSASPASGSAPLTVAFTDSSTGSPTSWKWVFGDGGASTEKNIVHTYNKTGLFTVTLTASNAGGCNALAKSSYIAVSNSLEAPIAAFSASPTSGIVPLKVQFTDSSIGSPTSWKWNFGNGNTSTGQNPVQIYNKTGKYTVSLTVNNPEGSSTETVSGYITVS